jgi:hypothetical protein
MTTELDILRQNSTGTSVKQQQQHNMLHVIKRPKSNNNTRNSLGETVILSRSNKSALKNTTRAPLLLLLPDFLSKFAVNKMPETRS